MKHLATKVALLAVLLLLPNLGIGFPNLPLVDPPLKNKIGWKP
jgi:hypothetical protein